MARSTNWSKTRDSRLYPSESKGEILDQDIVIKNEHGSGSGLIRAVLFDLDRTLLDRDISFQNFVVSQYLKFQGELGHIPQEVYVRRVIALDNRGALWKDKVYQAITEEFSIAGLSWQHLFEDFNVRITNYYVSFPHLLEMLEALKASGYVLGMISNGLGLFQWRSICALRIEDYFDTILISEIVGLRKPDPKIFRQALHDLQCEPAHSLFVGDHPIVDIEGARQAGMKTAWKKDPDYHGQVEADIIFDDLADLAALIRDL